MVNDINETTSFYKKLFQEEPVKVKTNYVKFELEDPSLVISFIQRPEGVPEMSWSSSGAHFGIRVSTTEEVNQRYDYLRSEAIPVSEENDTICCYARQDKFWVNDPDGIRWEVYTFHEDSDQFTANDSTCCQIEDEATEESVSCC